MGIQQKLHDYYMRDLDELRDKAESLLRTQKSGFHSAIARSRILRRAQGLELLRKRLGIPENLELSYLIADLHDPQVSPYDAISRALHV